jgi:hypothetical protein
MSVEAPRNLEALEPGQLWKFEEGFILICEHGKRLVAYKRLKSPSQRAAATNLICPEALANYLNTVRAELVLSRDNT